MSSINSSVYSYVNLVIDFLPVCAGLIRVRCLRREMIVFFAFVILACATDVVLLILARRGFHNLWVMHLYHPIEYSCLVIVFSYWQVAKPAIARPMRMSVAVYLLVWVIVTATGLEPLALGRPDVVSHTISGVVILAIAMLTLVQLASETEKSEVQPSRDPRWWITSGVLVYFCGTVTLVMLGETVVKLRSPTEIWMIQLVRWVMNYLTNIIFTIGLLLIRRTK